MYRDKQTTVNLDRIVDEFPVGIFSHQNILGVFVTTHNDAPVANDDVAVGYLILHLYLGNSYCIRVCSGYLLVRGFV